MSLDYIPDYVSGTNPVNTPPGYCRHTNGDHQRRVQHRLHAAGCDEPMFASEFNRLYYNPNINYDPPVDGAGNQANARASRTALRAGFTRAYG